MTGSAFGPQFYLDHNATAPVRPAAIAAVEAALRRCGNPSSVHGAGRAARRTVEDARDAVAALVGADSVGVIFTSGGTEANFLALNGAGRTRVLASTIEHSAVLNARDGIELVPVTADGVVDLARLEAMLTAGGAPALVSVMLANNETGVIQPLEDVVRLAHAHGALVHTDAVQAAGKIAVDMASLGVDMLSLSAHKIGGPQGVGAVVLAPGVSVAGIVTGGGQERGRRGGTENVPGIAGFGAAAVEALAELNGFTALASMRDGMERAVRKICPGAVVYGERAPRLPNTSFLSMPGVKAETQVMAFDLAGIAVSAGSACSSGKVAASRVLRAMGAADADNAVRVSLGASSKESDVSAFLDAWASLYTRRGDGRAAAQPAA